MKSLKYYFISQKLCDIYYFKQNERFKLKRYDPARTRTWNLLIRSQTPYPLGHEAEIGQDEFYCFLKIICCISMLSKFSSVHVVKRGG